MKLINIAIFISLISLSTGSFAQSHLLSDVKTNSAQPALSTDLQTCDREYTQDPSKGKSCYENLVKKKPGTIDAAKIRLTLKGLSLDQQVDFYNRIIDAQNKLKDLNAVIKWAAQGLELEGLSNNNKASFYRDISEANIKQGNFSDAINAAQKGIDLNNTNSEINQDLYNNLGYAQLKKKNFVDAEKNLKKSISLGARFPNVYFNLGLLYNDKLYDEWDLRPEYKNAPIQNKEFTELATKMFTNFGLGYKEKGDFLAARANLEMALQTNPKDQKLKDALAGLPPLDRTIPKDVTFDLAKNNESCEKKALDIQTAFKETQTEGHTYFLNADTWQPVLMISDHLYSANELGYRSAYYKTPAGILLRLTEGDRREMVQVKSQPIEQGMPCLFTLKLGQYTVRNVFFTAEAPPFGESN